MNPQAKGVAVQIGGQRCNPPVRTPNGLGNLSVRLVVGFGFLGIGDTSDVPPGRQRIKQEMRNRLLGLKIAVPPESSMGTTAQWNNPKRGPI
jgi:hypothetical protein